MGTLFRLSQLENVYRLETYRAVYRGKVLTFIFECRKPSSQPKLKILNYGKQNWNEMSRGRKAMLKDLIDTTEDFGNGNAVKKNGRC
jgi:hypothetical protein